MSDRTHRQLKTVSNGLLVYGIVGIVLTVILLGITVTVGSRLDTLSSRLTSRLETISVTIDKTATTLESAGSTSGSFSSTIAQGATTIGQANATLGEVVTAIRDLQTVASTLSILGQTPLSSLSNRFGTIATQLETLQGRVGELGTNLGSNSGTSLRERASPDPPGRAVPTLRAVAVARPFGPGVPWWAAARGLSSPSRARGRASLRSVDSPR